MKAELVRIGNSRGIRIPKPLIEHLGLGNVVDLKAEKNCLIISPGRRPREHWEEMFQAAGASEKDENLLDGMDANEFDKKEWRW